MELTSHGLADTLHHAQDDCYAVVRALELKQLEHDDDAPLAAMLAESLTGVYAALETVSAALDDGSIAVVTRE